MEEEGEIDEEERKRREEEDAERKKKPENFKANLLSMAGQGTFNAFLTFFIIDNDPIENMMNMDKNKSQYADYEYGKILGEASLHDLNQSKEDYYKYLQKALDRNKVNKV